MKNIEELKSYKEKLSRLSELEEVERNKYLRKIATGEIQGPMVGYPSIDKPWLKFYPEESLEFEVPKMSMFQYLVNSTKKYGDFRALDYRMSINNFNKPIKTITYKEFIDEIVTIACGFKSLGFKPEDIVVELLPNFIESREAIYGANAVGTTVYPISPMVPISKAKEIINDKSVKNIVVFSKFYDKFADIIQNSDVEHIIYLDGRESFNPFLSNIALIKDRIEKKGDFALPDDKRIITWDKLKKIGEKYRKENNIYSVDDFVSYYSPEHIALIEGTSGTTGVSKGACLTDYAINACDFCEEIPHPFEAGESNLDILIQSISFGIAIMHHTLCGGLDNIIIPELITDNIGEVLAKIKPDNFSGGPVHYENIIKSKEYKNGLIPPHKNFICGGASLSKITEKKLNGVENDDYFENGSYDSKIFVRQGLGCTENTGTGIFTTKGSYKFGSVGIPIALSNCSIFEYGTDNELPVGEVGEICLSGPTMMKEYYNNPDETSKVIKVHSDGTKWLHLGDCGYIDKNGNVFIIDRYKNIFMRSGFNVHPSKIADLINSCDLVENCYVVGVDHPKEITVPVAFVVLKNDIDKNTAVDYLNNLCLENLDEYSIPYEFVFVDELPLNLGGKVDSKKLLSDSKINYEDENSVKKLQLR